MTDRERNYWSVQTGHAKLDEYADQTGRQYGYSSNVPNHKQVKVGDVLFVRDSYGVLGTGVVDAIDTRDGEIHVQRCPSCNRAKVRYRSSSGDFRCEVCKSVFKDPLGDAKSGTWYRAWYASTWHEFSDPPSLASLQATYAGKPSQNAIERLDPSKALELLRRNGDATQLALGAPTSAGPQEVPGGHTFASTKIRRGQARFRQALIRKFGPACAVTGPCPPRALEAAHLTAFALGGQHKIDEGLLLRADIHRLLDAHELGIDTDTWTVQLAPHLREHPAVASLHGTSLALEAHALPTPQPLIDHLYRCQVRWATGQGPFSTDR